MSKKHEIQSRIFDASNQMQYDQLSSAEIKSQLADLATEFINDGLATGTQVHQHDPYHFAMKFWPADEVGFVYSQDIQFTDMTGGGSAASQDDAYDRAMKGI